MFIFSILIGIYSYLIFTLGILGMLSQINIGILTFLYIIIIIFIKENKLIKYSKKISNILKSTFNLNEIKSNKIFYLLIVLFLSQAFVNLIGALGPELAFDALWYHLTIPKIWLNNNSIFYIPGGLLYYSAMPKLGEMLYLSVLPFGGEIVAKLIHYLFGIFICIALYKFSRKFFSSFISMLSVLIFYSNLVVAWESITAYNDLIRTFYEFLALWAFVNWINEKKQKWLISSSVMIGFAITTKLIAMGSLFIFLFLTILLSKKANKIINAIVYFFIALLIPLPWFIFSFLNTGNPVFPVFSDILIGVNEKILNIQLLNPYVFISSIWNVFSRASDPISPVYIILLPLLFLTLAKSNFKVKIIYLYAFFGLIFWYSTSRVEGSRMLLPYLPAFSIICASIINKFKQSKLFFNLLIVIVIVSSAITIGYRFFANYKYIPVILGLETKSQFLEKNLNFSFGDFFDIDGYFEYNISEKDTVLLYGFHNLYYIEFPFIDSTWLRSSDEYNYIATQNSELPEKFQKSGKWNLLYSNPKTMVKLYKRKSFQQ